MRRRAAGECVRVRSAAGSVEGSSGARRGSPSCKGKVGSCVRRRQERRRRSREGRKTRRWRRRSAC